MAARDTNGKNICIEFSINEELNSRSTSRLTRLAQPKQEEEEENTLHISLLSLYLFIHNPASCPPVRFPVTDF